MTYRAAEGAPQIDRSHEVINLRNGMPWLELVASSVLGSVLGLFIWDRTTAARERKLGRR